MQTQLETLKNDTILMRISPFIIGSLAGMIEVTCNHPMWIIKTLIQTRRTNNATIPAVQNVSGKDLLNPRLLYSGVLANALSMIPATGLRIGMNHTLTHAFASDINSPTFFENLLFMGAAGVSASFVCGPVDLINIMKYKLKRQAILFPEQKIETSFIAAAAYLIKQQNGFQCLAYGLPATMFREGAYTPFFLGMTPYVKSKIRPYVDNVVGATIASSVITGITVSTVTQPLDTIKTRQQDIQLNQTKRPDNWLTTAGKIYNDGGLPKFFTGGFWRMARIASAISIMTLATDKIYGELNKHKQ